MPNNEQEFLEDEIKKMGLGSILERWILAILSSLFPAREGYRILHSDFKNYNKSMGHGVDGRVFERNRQTIAYECKNWARIGKKYGLDIAVKEIIERFARHAGGLKILFISYLDVLTQPAIAAIKSSGIHILEIGKLIGHKDFKSQLFYTVKSAVHKLLNKLSTPTFTSYPLSNYSSTSNTTIPSIIEDNTKNNNTKNKNDTDLVVNNEAMRTIERALWYWTWINSLAEHCVRWAIEELEH